MIASTNQTAAAREASGSFLSILYWAVRRAPAKN